MNEKDWPLVSVVTPAYNQAAYLKATIESVLSQDYPHIEYFVFDDGSTDETRKILEEYDGRFFWESQPNMGQTPTINKGWKKSKGSIIAWLNSDDTFMEGAVRRGVEYLLQHPETGIVFGDTLLTEADGRPIDKSAPQPPFSYERFLVNCNNTVSQPSTFIRREVWEKTGELDPRFYYFMDWDYWLRAGLNFKIDHLPEVLSTYRLHADSKTVAQAAKSAPELEYMYEKFFSRIDLPKEISRKKRKAMMNMCFTSGGYYLKGGDRKGAVRMAKHAFAYNPLGIFSLRNISRYLHCRYGGKKTYQQLKRIVKKSSAPPR